MRYPSLNQLYFETLRPPSTAALWIGCSIIVHAGIFLLPLGGVISRQNINFQPGDAGVQVELTWSEPEPAASQPVAEQTPPEIELPVAEVILPPQDEIAFAEPEPKRDPHKVAASKSNSVRKDLKTESQIPSGSGARAGSATAQPAAAVFTPQPPYPQTARDLGVEGHVRLRVRIAPDGSARTVEIARSSGRADFDGASLNTVKREWRFSPARSFSGAPVESTKTVAVHFTLRS